ncbi:tRNA (adenosine(37)-N6)-threonylcarbamoyltransferase complex ATPase subunit type 1 TsaE [soil metagenome]
MTEAQLEEWGARIGSTVITPVFLALSGELGAGKSVLARAIARGAGVNAVMPSPTYNLMFRYDSGRGVAVVHLDLYRLERAQEVWELGWRELGADDEIVIVEWPERAEDLLPPDRWDIRLEVRGPALRTVTGTAFGQVPALPMPEA